MVQLRALYFPLRSSYSVSHDTVSPCCIPQSPNEHVVSSINRGDEMEVFGIEPFPHGQVLVMATPTERTVVHGSAGPCGVICIHNLLHEFRGHVHDL